MAIKQSVINTFKRVGIDYESLEKQTEIVTVANRFGAGSCETTPLIARCIEWVYETSDAYEAGDFTVKTADFDRVRYFVAGEDMHAYSTCLD